MSERSSEADLELSGVNVAEETPARCFYFDLPCYGMMVSLLLELGRDLSNPLRCEGLLLG
jgi:hypothetical protein